MYDHERLLLTIRKQLARSPSSGLAEIASSLGVSQRTLERCLNARGVRFRDLRSEVLIERVRSLFGSSLQSKKEIAYALGFSSPGALYQFLRRHGIRVRPTNKPASGPKDLLSRGNSFSDSTAASLSNRLSSQQCIAGRNGRGVSVSARGRARARKAKLAPSVTF